jgi:hypothetical protein
MLILYHYISSYELTQLSYYIIKILILLSYNQHITPKEYIKYSIYMMELMYQSIIFMLN